jgi:prefoldin subunit 5
MGDVFFQYAIEKGGVFGFLFLLAIAWIVYREKFFGASGEKTKERDESEKKIKDAIKESIKDLDARFLDFEKKLEDLWTWHNVRDQDGVPVWYVKRSFEESLDLMEKSITNLEKLIEKDLKNIENYLEKNDDLNEKIYEINNSRIEDYRKMLEDYNKTMKELTIALDKIKLILKTKPRGE